MRIYRLVATTPFRTSMPITKLPQREPRTRKVLVAPALPLPYSRISIPKKDRLTHTAVGIEPIRYAEMMSKTSFIDSSCASLIGCTENTHSRCDDNDGPSAGGLPVRQSWDNKYNEKSRRIAQLQVLNLCFSNLRQIQLPSVILSDTNKWQFAASFSISSASSPSSPLISITPPSINCCPKRCIRAINTCRLTFARIKSKN